MSNRMTCLDKEGVVDLILALFTHAHVVPKMYDYLLSKAQKDKLGKMFIKVCMNGDLGLSVSTTDIIVQQRLSLPLECHISRVRIVLCGTKVFSCYS